MLRYCSCPICLSMAVSSCCWLGVPAASSAYKAHSPSSSANMLRVSGLLLLADVLQALLPRMESTKKGCECATARRKAVTAGGQPCSHSRSRRRMLAAARTLTGC